MGGCSNEPRSITVKEKGDVVATEPSRSRSAIQVVKEEVTVTDGVLTMAGLFVNSAERTIGDIEIGVSLKDENGEVVDTFGENLPFCPPDTDCWWGSRFPEYELIEVSDVELSVTDDGGFYPDPVDFDPEVVEFSVRRGRDGIIRGKAPRSSGMVFVLGFVNDEPRSGIGVNVFDLPRQRGRTLSISADLLPVVSREERLRAYMYPFDVELGH